MTDSTAEADPQTQTDQEKPEHAPTIRVEEAGPARKKISIEISQEAISAKLEENYDSLQDEAVIPGFRRGHAPQRLLEKRFGDQVRKDVCRQLIGDAYSQAVDENELRVLGEPDMENLDELELPASGALTTTVEVEVVPDFKLPDLKGLEVKKPVIEVNDGKIDAEIDRYCEMYGQFKAVDAAQDDDYLTANVKVFDAEGELIDEFKGTEMLVPGSKRKYKGAVGGIFVDDLGKQLKGKKAGDTLEMEATGPDRHENDKVAGQKVKIDLEVTQIRRLTPISVKELVEAMGVEDEKTLRKEFKKSLEAQAKNEQTRAMHQQLIDELVKQVEMELPEKVSSRQAGSIVQRRAVELMQMGVAQDEIDHQLAELRESSEEQAKRDLKKLFLFDAVARELEVEVSEPEVNGQISMMAQRQGIRPERLRDQLYNTGQLDQLFIQIREHKALAKLLGEATIIEEEAKKSTPKKKSTAKKSGKKKSSGGKKPAAKKKSAKKSTAKKPKKDQQE